MTEQEKDKLFADYMLKSCKQQYLKIDAEQEILRINDEIVDSMSRLARYLGRWFDRDGDLTHEISHENLANMASAILGYSMEIMSDNARRNYVISKRDADIIMEYTKELNENDEPDENVQGKAEGEQQGL